MQVYIRHTLEEKGSFCGEMNHEQLYNFVSDLKRQGIHDRKMQHFNVETVTQFVDTGEEFFVEIEWEEIDEI